MQNKRNIKRTRMENENMKSQNIDHIMTTINDDNDSDND